MFITPPRKPKLAVIYIREGIDIPSTMTAELQELTCREFCATRRIPVSHSVRVCCGPAESLEVLKSLVRTLPKQVDTLIAMRFFCYSTLLPELGKLCFIFQCRPTWLFSFDIVGPIQNMFYELTDEDLEESDQRYLELLREE